MNIWATPGGRGARRYLETWGDVQRERYVTGDPTAVPPVVGERLPGTGRGLHSLPETVLVAADVDAQIARCKGVGTRLLLLHIYRDGCQILESGGRVWIYDLDEFTDPLVDQLARHLGWTRYERRQHLEMTHQFFAMRLARDKGLGSLEVPTRATEAS